jgi:hypothetical protein
MPRINGMASSTSRSPPLDSALLRSYSTAALVPAPDFLLPNQHHYDGGATYPR